MDKAAAKRNAMSETESRERAEFDYTDTLQLRAWLDNHEPTVTDLTMLCEAAAQSTRERIAKGIREKYTTLKYTSINELADAIEKGEIG